MKCVTVFCFTVLVFCFIADTGALKEKCKQCVPINECVLFKDMKLEEQRKMMENFPCDEAPGGSSGSSVFGFSEIAKGDQVCCPENVWGIEGPDDGDQKENSNSDNGSDKYEEQRLPYWHERPSYNAGGWGHHRPQQNAPNYNNRQNGYPSYNNNNNNRRNNLGNNNYERTNRGGQCQALTSVPPSPTTGCCGRDLSLDAALSNNERNRYASQPNQNQNAWSRPEYPQYNSWGNSPRYSRSADNDTGEIEISVDNRIAGGKETTLDQYPWTVLLKTTFDYGTKVSAFNCGGSIISARYILTAAHCVYETNAVVTEVEVRLAEYDKRTFPKDCVMTRNGKECVENLVTKAENFVYHPEYDDQRLQNDIALVRLRENAPYTEFIRPICLPPIDIDEPKYYDLRLAVAGWGRNREQTSKVKQSTVVNLVPQRECSQYYPHLTRRHLCAAGHSGEDTCKGDSGGPLMMLYEKKYFVSGVVSGKRADSPCGTAVPSLYTNVYHYKDWILSNIKD